MFWMKFASPLNFMKRFRLFNECLFPWMFYKGNVSWFCLNFREDLKEIFVSNCKISNVEITTKIDSHNTKITHKNKQPVKK